MGFLNVVEVPLTVVIAVAALVEHGYCIFYRSLESKTILDENALSLKDIVLVAFAVMSLIGTISSKMVFGLFTFAFMIYSFVLSTFSFFHIANQVIRSVPDACHQVHIGVQLSETECWIVDGMLLSLGLISVGITALATVCVYDRLTTVTLPITIDPSRQQATRRRLVEVPDSDSEPEVPVLLSSMPVKSPVVDNKFKINTFSPMTEYYV